MKIALMLTLLFAAHNCSVDAPRPQSSDLVGRWKVDITFVNESTRSLSLDAEDSGKGSLLVEGARSNWDEPAKPSQAKLTVGNDLSPGRVSDRQRRTRNRRVVAQRRF